MSGKGFIFLLLVASGLPAAVWGQAPKGPEFRVNLATPGAQVDPAVSQARDGSFFVVWAASSTESASFDIFARRFGSDGVARGAEFQVNAWTTGEQSVARVGQAADGGFLVVWQSVGEDGSVEGIAARRFDSGGHALGPDFVVNATRTGVQRDPSVACSLDGGCTVAWTSVGQDGSADGVYARRLDSGGALLGGEFQVNTYTTGAQSSPSVSRAPGGGFLVVWHSAGQGGGSRVFGKRYASGGAALGGEFHVGAASASFQRFPVAAHDTDGGFVVAWQDPYLDGSGVFGIAAQSFDSLGRPLGEQFLVNSYTTGIQFLPAVGRQADGHFLVAWDSIGQDGSSTGVYARSLERRSRALGPEFRVNATTAGYQASAAISSGVSGRFVVAWTGQDGSDRGIFAQRYATTFVPAFGGTARSLLAAALLAVALRGRAQGPRCSQQRRSRGTRASRSMDEAKRSC
jgi:hypothetical protein